MIGTTVSHYRILDRLGAGGMGEVYLAEDTTLHRRIALKFLQGASASSEHAKQRFLREARAAAMLKHPNIVHIYEVGEADGNTFIAMEHVEGQTLGAHMGGRALPAAEIVRLGIEIADAIEEANSAGITHRDIKPSNIMITARGQVKVLDFGLARMPQPESSHGDASTQLRTEEGVLVGTVDYMSPEQALGREVDPRTDLFSLGVVLYELSTGRRPFSGATPTETVDRILHAQPESVARFNPVPAELERIIRKCLEKERDSRYQSARELVTDLRNLQRDLRLPEQSSERSRVSRRWLPALALLAAIAIVAAGVVLLRARREPIHSVAVLPFVNSASDPNLEYLSDGVTENLINRLAQLSDVRVVPRSTVFRYKGRDLSPRAIGRELEVGAVLLGRVSGRGPAQSISVELVDVAKDAQLWGAQYDVSVTNLLAIQDEIASSVATRLQLSVSDPERRALTRRYTEHNDAHLLYLKGRYFWNKRSEDGIRKGIEYFRQAIEIDPLYSLAYAGLADSYNFLGAFGLALAPPEETMPKARAAAVKALEIDDSLAEAHASLGFVKFYYDWDAAGAEREFQRAIALRRDYAPAHQWYSHVLMARRRADEAIAAAKRAVRLDPLSLTANMNLGWQYDWSRQPDLAVEPLRRTLELDPHFSQARWGLGCALEQKGMFDAAADELQKAAADSGENSVVVAALARVHARAGRTAEARRIRDVLEERSKTGYVSPYAMASLHAAFGDKDETFRWLDLAFEERSGGMVWLDVDPRMDPLRSDPRFAALVRRVEAARRSDLGTL